jgi:HSP20 family protein
MAEKRTKKEEPQVVRASPIEKRERADIERTRGETFCTPDVDIYETGGELVLVADVPGVAKDGVDLKVEDGILEITAHRRPLEVEKDADYCEYGLSSYYRAFSLTEEIDTERIEAALKDGVLTVTLPKSEKAKPRKIAVKAG